MVIVPIGIGEKTNFGKSIIMIDTTTYTIITGFSSSNQFDEMVVGNVYEVTGEFLMNGYPQFVLKSFKIISEKIDMHHILDCMSTNPIGVDRGGCYGIVTKITDLIGISLNTTSAELTVTLAGYKSQFFNVILDDPRWNDFWTHNHKEDQIDLILDYMNNHDIYLVINYEKKGFDGKLMCSTMVVV